MAKLRPLLVLTGTLHVEGGVADRRENTKHKRAKGADHVTTSLTREVSVERRKGDTIVTGYIRRLAAFRLLKTPFGILVDPVQLGALKEVLAGATAAADEHNRQYAKARLTNCYLCEPLWGERLAAIERWIDNRIDLGDQSVIEALPRILANPAPVVSDPPRPQVQQVETGVK